MEIADIHMPQEHTRLQPPIIELKNLRKSYGSKQVLKGVTLSVQPGQVIGYIGPNGAGKSTTVKIITGLLGEYEGEVWLGGWNIRQKPMEAKSLIGYVPELADMYEVLTPREFLRFLASLHTISIEEADERMSSLMGAFGLGAKLDERMDSFSKGMKQKVLLTSALIHNPQILIMDEPLSGLDANSVIIVKELIAELAQAGKTIIYCSHMMDVVEKVSDRIVLLHQGEVIANGSFEELQRHAQSSQSLETIFSSLTRGGQDMNAAKDIIAALRSSTSSHP